LSIRISDFEFPSDFVLRISSFWAKPPNAMKRRVYRQTCPTCGNVIVSDQEEMIARLRSAGRLRRVNDVDPVFLFELVKSAAQSWACPKCSSTGLSVSMSDEDSEWPGAPRCEHCGKRISPERVAAFPGTRHCVDCQGKLESQQPVTDEFCPHCGTILVLRNQHGSGISRYVLVCPECKR